MMMNKIEKVLADMAYDCKCFKKVEFVNGIKLKESLKVKDLYIEIDNYENIILWGLKGEYLFTIRKKAFYAMMFELGYAIAKY